MKQSSFLIGLIIISMWLTACATATVAPATPPPPTIPSVSSSSAKSSVASSASTSASAAPVVLKLAGLSGAKSLTLSDVKALTATEGWAGIKSSTGKITVPEVYKGVSLAELAKAVGGMTPDSGITLTAKDGYAMTISYDQINKGDFITYDPGTGDEIKSKDPLTVIIAYEKAGKPLDEASEGTLKLVVVSAKNNQVVDGHWAVKWVTQIDVKALAVEWKLPLGGAITEEMDRGTFQSCAAKSCHGATWTDDKAQVWTGVPLWLIAGRVDDDIKHGDNSYNQKLADKGYQVHVVAVDGFKVALESSKVNRNNNIMVAYLVNNNPLDEKNFPLRLVGSDLKSNEMVGRVSKINLMLTMTTTTTSSATASPQPTATATKVASSSASSSASVASSASAPVSGAALTVNGAVDKVLTLSLDALKAMQPVKIKAEHPKQGMQDYEGVRLSVLLDQAKAKDTATKIVMTSGDGFASEVALADVKKCADCMIAFADGGKLNAAMPGMISSFWARDVVKIEVK